VLPYAAACGVLPYTIILSACFACVRQRNLPRGGGLPLLLTLENLGSGLQGLLRGFTTLPSDKVQHPLLGVFAVAACLLLRCLPFGFLQQA